MLSLGILSILQAVWLPGFLLVKSLRLGEGLLKTLVLSFAASLTINHLLVLLLVWLKAYNATTLYAIMAAEGVVLLILVWRDLARPLRSLIQEDLRRSADLLADADRQPVLVRSGAKLAMLAAFVALVACFAAGGYAASHVFDAWDAVVSWNAWARQWAEGKSAVDTWHYPQLLPTAYSLTYAFTGQTEVQFFARALAGLFPVVMLLALMDLALRTRQAAYCLAAAVTACGLRLLLVEYTVSGYADAPVACMGLITIYALILAGEAPTTRATTGHLVLAAIAAAGCACTKQAGWLVLAPFPVLTYLLVVHGREDLSVRRRLLLVAVASAMALLLAAPWHIYDRLIDTGTSTAVMFDQVLHRERTYLQRFAYGMGQLRERLGWAVLYVLLPASLLATICLDRKWRWVVLLVVVPSVVLWAVFFSYDLRNIAVAIPLSATAGALGAAAVFGPLGRRVAWYPRPMGPVNAVGLLVVVLLVAPHFRSSGSLRREQVAQQRLIGDPAFNAVLYVYAEQHGFHGTVLTNYQMMRQLPGLSQFYAYADNEFSTLEAVDARMKAVHARYVFHIGADYPAYLKKGVEDGRYREEFAGASCRMLVVMESH